MRNIGESIRNSNPPKPDVGTTILDQVALSSGIEGSATDDTDRCYQKGASILGTYRVESDAIESGGMGRVWRVHHTLWNVDLAMKQPRAKFFTGEDSKQNFIRECDTWIKLGLHPNIVSCYYVRQIDGIPTIFSEWMDGGDLAHAIQSGSLYEGLANDPKRVQERLLDVAIQFARGLHYAHEAREEDGTPKAIIHQDVKPGNVLLTKDGEVKVADFGLARARAVLTILEENEKDGTKPALPTRTILCPSGGYTPAYCSMEQMDGKLLSRRTDLYSWAVSVMELYVGGHPWANGVVAGLNCRKYLSEAAVPVPAPMADLLARCLAAEPDDRPRDFGLVIAELRAIYRIVTGEDYPRESSRAASDTADSLNNRALSMLDLGKLDEAEALWKKAIWTNSSRFLYHYNYAIFLWTHCKISDIELNKRFKSQRENSPLWARAMALFALMQHDEKSAAEFIALLEKLDKHDSALPSFVERLQAGQANTFNPEEKLLNLSELSVDGKQRVSGYYERINHEGEFGTADRYGYRIEQLDTGEIRDYPNLLEDYGPSTPYDGMVYMHSHHFKNKSARFVGSSSEVVAVDADVLWLFDAKNGRLLQSLPPIYDGDGDTSSYQLLGFTASGMIKYRDILSPSVITNSFSVMQIPVADTVFPFELVKIASTKERLTAQMNIEEHYREAFDYFENGDYSNAYIALSKSFEDNTLMSHAPSLRLWTALGEHLVRSKLAAVVPTNDAPSPLPKRNALNTFVDNDEPILISQVILCNCADNGQTAVTVHVEEESEYDTCNEYFEYSLSYDLTAYDILSHNEYYRVDSLWHNFQTDAVRLEKDLGIEFLSENKLWLFKESWGRGKTFDLSDREYQIEHRLKFMLPNGYFLFNTNRGVTIGGFEFDDAFDDFRPLWNADIIGCRKRNYRLVYQYILP